MDTRVSPNFVVRHREIAELVSALDDAMSGQGHLVMLAGEAGIGKTRVAQQLAGIAPTGRPGRPVAAATRKRVRRPTGPGPRACVPMCREREPDLLRSEMGRGAANVAEVVPEVRERLPDLEPSPVMEDPENARFRRFVRGERVPRKPLVLILDNHHWADASSLRLLEFMRRALATSESGPKKERVGRIVDDLVGLTGIGPWPRT